MRGRRSKSLPRANVTLAARRRPTRAGSWIVDDPGRSGQLSSAASIDVDDV